MCIPCRGLKSGWTRTGSVCGFVLWMKTLKSSSICRALLPARPEFASRLKLAQPSGPGQLLLRGLVAAEGKVADKAAALAEFTLDFQFPFMIDQDVLDDRQAESGAPCLGIAGGVNPIEAFGQARNMNRVKTHPGICHAKMDTPFVRPPFNVDLATRWRVFHRVEQQVGKGAA